MIKERDFIENIIYYSFYIIMSVGAFVAGFRFLSCLIILLYVSDLYRFLRKTFFKERHDKQN